MIKKTLFSQIIQRMDMNLFKKAVDKYNTAKHNN
jgi:hypothetical protein